jgi:glucose-1-phosphate adenylyltransferase
MATNGPSHATLTMLLAGGEGERLYPLTRQRAKPAVPFGGLYRIIDFTLSNCLNSGLKRMYVLTQHHALSLDRHLRVAWSLLHPELGEFIQTVPPQLQLVSRWYAGTADAVFQNLHLLDEERPQYVLVVSGDHIYRMDYERLLAFHIEHDADVTLACTRVPTPEATRMGVVDVDAAGRICAFAEKPPRPNPLPDDAARALVNMGVYVFKTEPLVRALIADAKAESKHDFGHNIIPAMARTHRVYAYDRMRWCPPEQHYWQDVGTLDSYFGAHMDLLLPTPSFDLYQPDWPIRTYSGQHPPTVLRSAGGHEAHATDSVVSPGCVIEGGTVRRSVLSPGVFVGPGALVEECVLLPRVRVGAGVRLFRAIVDENVAIPPQLCIGGDHVQSQQRFDVTANGVTIVPDTTLLA